MGTAADGALIGLGGIDLGAVAHGAVPDHGVGADGAVLTDAGAAPENGAGQDHGARADLHTGVDIDRGGIQEPNAVFLVLFHHPVPEQQLHLLDGVCAVDGDPASDAVGLAHVVVGSLGPGLLQNGAGGGGDIAFAGLLQRQHQTGDDHHVLLTVHKLQKRLMLFGDGHLSPLRKAVQDLLGVFGPAGNKKPPDAIGQ